MKRQASVLLLAGVLAGCGIPASAATTQAQGDGGTSVSSVVLRNGVRCAVMDAPHSSQLVCAWDGPRAAPTGQEPKGDRGTTITVTRLPDGTECAVMDARQGSGLSCQGMR